MGIPISIPAGIDIYVGGSLIVSGGFNLPDNNVTDNKVAVGANIAALKLEHQYEPTIKLSDHATSVAAQRVPAHKVKGAVANIVEFKVDCSVPPTAGSSCTVDLLKNGATVLSAPITLDDTAVANTAVIGAIASPDLLTGDRLDVVVAGVTGTTAKGVGAYPVIRERAQ